MEELSLRSVRSVQFASDRRMGVVCFWMFTITPTWFTAQDAMLFAEGAVPLSRVLMRAFPVIAPLLGLVALRWVKDQESFRQTAFWISLLIAATIFASNALRPDAESIPLRGRIMAPALMYLLLPNSLGRQIAAPLLLSAGLIALRLARVDDLTVPAFAADVVIVLILNAAGILTVRRRLELEESVVDLWKKEHESRAAATRADADLQSLRGIIPICSYCRQVRSEVGDWQKVEQYVREHSQADFSHGICPDCRAVHFPEYSPDR